MKLSSRVVLVFVLMVALFSLTAHGQMLRASQYKADSATVADMVKKAQADCVAGLACVIEIAPELSGWAQGTMPARCAKCTWLDYRNGALDVSKLGAVRFVGYDGLQAAIDSCPTENTGGCALFDTRSFWAAGSGVLTTSPVEVITSTLRMKMGVHLMLACGARYDFKNPSGNAVETTKNSEFAGCGSMPAYQGGTEIYFEGANGANGLNWSTNDDFSAGQIHDIRVTDGRASNVAGSRTGAGIFINRGTNGSSIRNVHTIGFFNGIKLTKNTSGTDGPNFFEVADSFITSADGDCVYIENPTETVNLRFMGIDNCGEGDGANANTPGVSNYGAVKIFSADNSRANVLISNLKYEHSSGRPNVTSTWLFLDSTNGAPVTASGVHEFIGSGNTAGSAIVVRNSTSRLQVNGHNFTNTTGGYGSLTNVIEDRNRSLTLTVANWGFRFSEILWESGNQYYRINGKVLVVSGGQNFQLCDATNTCTNVIDRNSSGAAVLPAQAVASGRFKVTDQGTKTLASGSGSVTFAASYTAAPVCFGTDQTTAAAVKITTTTTAATITGTGSDVVAYVCFGN